MHLPLSAWAAGVDLARVNEVTFEFAAYTTGELMFDDLEVMR